MIKLIGIGKTSHSFIKEGCDLYLKRLKYYCKTEEAYFPEIAKASSFPETEVKKREAEILNKRISNDDLIICLDENGKQFSSREFSKQLSKWMQLKKNVVFVVGGAYGLHDTLLERSHQKLSFSPMTFNHQMIRMVLLEQIYRAFTIMNNEPYHHG